jgi:hypothetical protein
MGGFWGPRFRWPGLNGCGNAGCRNNGERQPEQQCGPWAPPAAHCARPQVPAADGVEAIMHGEWDGPVPGEPTAGLPVLQV